MSKRNKMPAADVLDWLLKTHPELHQTAEIDRDWIWLSVSLSGDEHKATRDSLKAFGFAAKIKGVHALPNGRSGTWSHSCQRPLSFKYRGNAKASGGARRAGDDRAQPELTDAQLLKFAAEFAA